MTLTPIRITQNQASEVLSISSELMSKLNQTYPTFPKPYQTGTSQQYTVYYDYQALKQWHISQLSQIIQVENATISLEPQQSQKPQNLTLQINWTLVIRIILTIIIAVINSNGDTSNPVVQITQEVMQEIVKILIR